MSCGAHRHGVRAKSCCGFGNLREEFVEETWIKAAKEHGLGNPEWQLLQVADSSG